MLIALMYMFAILGVGLLLAAAVLQFRLTYPSPELNKLLQALAAFNLNFQRRFITPDKSHIIALDEAGRQLAVGMYYSDKQKSATAALYTFEAILGSEIVENALTLTKASKTSRITSSLMQSPPLQTNMFAAERTMTAVREPGDAEEVHELTLKIYLSSTDTPVLSIPFLPGLVPAKKSDQAYSEAFTEVQHVHEMIREIVSA